MSDAEERPRVVQHGRVGWLDFNDWLFFERHANLPWHLTMRGLNLPVPTLTGDERREEGEWRAAYRRWVHGLRAPQTRTSTIAVDWERA